MEKQKRLVTVNDISGFGKCSLTVALPLISAAGIETVCLPTAVLSTHTGGFEGYTYRDLTDDIPKIAEHWKSIGISFDAIYSGFLGSFRQVSMVKDFVKEFKKENTLYIADPCMADFGKMYSVFDKKFAKEMTSLCALADIILPNITEACFMTDTQYISGVQSREYIETLLKKLSALGPKNVILTGVSFEKGKLGAASFDGKEISYYFNDELEGTFHGTGDVFTCAFTDAVLTGFSIKDAVRIAVNFTFDCIKRTKLSTPDTRYGVDFERGIPYLLKELKLL